MTSDTDRRIFPRRFFRFFFLCARAYFSYIIVPIAKYLRSVVWLFFLFFLSIFASSARNLFFHWKMFYYEIQHIFHWHSGSDSLKQCCEFRCADIFFLFFSIFFGWNTKEMRMLLEFGSKILWYAYLATVTHCHYFHYGGSVSYRDLMH